MAAEDKLRELGITLPEIPGPAGNYVHAVRTGNLLFLAGKGPLGSKGKVGAELSTNDGYACAREVGLILLAVLRGELGTFTSFCFGRSTEGSKQLRIGAGTRNLENGVAPEGKPDGPDATAVYRPAQSRVS